MKFGDFDIIRTVPIMSATFYSILIFFLGIIIWFWLKGDSITIRKMPAIFASFHFILAAIFYIVILVWTKYDEEAGVCWRVFSCLDWPISFILKTESMSTILASIMKVSSIKNIPHTIINNTILFINFSILGTIQYYIWGLIISKILLLLKR